MGVGVSIKKAHQKRQKCGQCHKFFIAYETGSVKIAIDRLIDGKAIIKTRFCSIACAAEYINKHNKAR